MSLFFFKQKTAYEMRISDWSSDVCSSDLHAASHSPSSLPTAFGTATHHRVSATRTARQGQPSPARAVNRTHIRPSCRTQTEVRRQRLMMIRTAHEALLEIGRAHV